MEAPFKTLEEIQAFINEHWKGQRGFMVYHEGINAYTFQDGSFRGYGAHYGPNSQWEWRYGLDGSIEQRER